MPVFTSGGVISHKAIAKHHIGLDALLGEGGELYEYLEAPIPFLFCSVPRTVYDSCRPSPARASRTSRPAFYSHLARTCYCSTSNVGYNLSLGRCC